MKSYYAGLVEGLEESLVGGGSCFVPEGEVALDYLDGYEDGLSAAARQAAWEEGFQPSSLLFFYKKFIIYIEW